MSAARRVVRATELERVLGILSKHGVAPADLSFVLLPGGAIELHKFAPTPANDAVETDAERAAWDAVLGK